MWSLEITFDTSDACKSLLLCSLMLSQENYMEVYGENYSESAWNSQCEDWYVLTEQLFSHHCHCPFFVSSTYFIVK